MQPSQIANLSPKKLLGHSRRMSLSTNETVAMFRAFMPKVKTIEQRTNESVIDLRIYDAGTDLATFSPMTPFTKWVAVEVNEFPAEGGDLARYNFSGGLYAMFLHRGPASAFGKVIGQIFGQWLPSSGYLLDDRPHFEVLPKGYRMDDPDAEEEIWIPIKPTERPVE